MATATAYARSIKANSAARFAELWRKADEAGKAAAEALTPIPMIVGSPTTPLGSDLDYSKPTYYVADGVCGFAWVTFPGNTAFGRWAKGAGFASKAYGGGLSYWVRGYGQSMERKAAYAGAFAAVLREEGVDKVYAQSRMD